MNAAPGQNPPGTPAHRREGYSPGDMDGEPLAAPGNPAAEWWTMGDIAAYLSRRHGRQVKVTSVYRYRARPRERGGLPPAEPPDGRMFGRTPVWKPQAIIGWDDHERRGHGWRAGRRGPAGASGGTAGSGGLGEPQSLAAVLRQ